MLRREVELRDQGFPGLALDFLKQDPDVSVAAILRKHVDEADPGGEIGLRNIVAIGIGAECDERVDPGKISNNSGKIPDIRRSCSPESAQSPGVIEMAGFCESCRSPSMPTDISAGVRCALRACIAR